jgi:hypothetical protein
MTSAPTLSLRDAFVEDAVRFVLGGASIEHLAALHAMKPCEVLAALDDPVIAALVDRAAAEAERNGTALKQRARFVIGDAVRKLADTVAGDDVSPSFLLRVVDVLGKQAAETQDKGQAALTTFTINIDLSDHSVSLSSASQPLGEVIDV